MAHRVPTPEPTKVPDPLINLGETSADLQNQKNKKGLLSTFLQGRNKSAGVLGGVLNGMQQQQPALGNSNI